MLVTMLRRMLRFPIGGDERPAIGHVGLAALVVLVVVGFGVSLCWRGIILSDEGYLLLQALDMRDGKVLYRDMDAFVTPGIWLVLAATFKLLGPSVLASRVPALLALLAMYGASYAIVARLCGRAYGLTTLGLLAAVTVWAFPSWTFAFYSPFSVTFALLGLERLLAYRSARGASGGTDGGPRRGTLEGARRHRALFWCGVFGVL